MKGYRSIIVNVLTGVALLLAHPDVLSVVPPEWVRFFPAIQAAVAVLMRFQTTTPVGESAPRD